MASDPKMNEVVDGLKKDPALWMQWFYDVIYWQVSSAVIDKLGKEGIEALREGIRRYGVYRGERLREEHLQKGLELNVENLMNHYDLQTQYCLRRKRFVFTPEEMISEVYECPHYEVWKALGKLDVAVLYCEEFHPAMWCAYNPKMKLRMPKILTKGDGCCRFELKLDS
jgi:hypothetical protein